MSKTIYAKTKQVQTTLLDDDFELLDAYAERKRISRADAIRSFILDGLEADMKRPTDEPAGNHGPTEAEKEAESVRAYQEQLRALQAIRRARQ